MKFTLMAVLTLMGAVAFAQPDFNYDENDVANDPSTVNLCAKIVVDARRGTSVTADNQDGFLWKEMLCDLVPKEKMIQAEKEIIQQSSSQRN